MVHQLHTRFPKEPLASDMITLTRQVRSALRQAAVNIHPGNVIIRTLCAELLQWDECCHLTAPAGTRLSFTANLIIRRCASSKNPSRQLPFQRWCSVGLSRGLIGIIDQYVPICDFSVCRVSGTDEPQGRDSRHGWCLRSSWSLENKMPRFQEMKMAKIPVLLFNLWGDVHHNCAANLMFSVFR